MKILLHRTIFSSIKAIHKDEIYRVLIAQKRRHLPKHQQQLVKAF